MSTIEQSVEVEAPLSTVYNQGTQFEESRASCTRTRVMVQMDSVPEGLGDSDLERFKQLIESRGAETGGWCAEVNRRNEI